METIKKSPNVEFEVIYADGERRRVSEGVLYGVEADGSITLHNGTDSTAVWFAVAGGILISLNACNALPAFVLNWLMDTESFHALKKLAEEVNRNIWLKNPATFRLGQMDMRESVADMLEAVAEQSDDENDRYRYAFLKAAALVRSMEIPGGD